MWNNILSSLNVTFSLYFIDCIIYFNADWLNIYKVHEKTTWEPKWAFTANEGFLKRFYFRTILF